MSYNDFLMYVFGTALAVILVSTAIGFASFVFKCIRENWRD